MIKISSRNCVKCWSDFWNRFNWLLADMAKSGMFHRAINMTMRQNYQAPVYKPLKFAPNPIFDTQSETKDLIQMKLSSLRVQCEFCFVRWKPISENKFICEDVSKWNHMPHELCVCVCALWRHECILEYTLAVLCVIKPKCLLLIYSLS